MSILFENISFINGGETNINFVISENKMDFYEGIPGFWLYIPKAHARMETIVKPKIDCIPEDDRYEFYVFRQTGSSTVRRDTYVLYRLPSDRKVAIRIYMDGGVDWVKEDRKFALRETDEIDRRIILGFCYKYQNYLFDLSHTDFDKLSSGKRKLEYNALDFVYTMVPKRIKKGSLCNDFTDEYRSIHAIDLWDESSLFNDVKFLN